MKFVLYPLRKQKDYTELLYSLRSIDKYLIRPYVVIIVGEHLPDWLNRDQVVFIEFKEGTNKQSNIRNKILLGFELCDEMFFMNDDVYLLKPINPANVPYFTCGPLTKSGEAGAVPLRAKLEALGKPQKHYDGHWPIIFEEEKFKQACSVFIKECIIKSMYGNYWELPNVEIPDFKVHGGETEAYIRNVISDRYFFSTGPMGVKAALPVLEQLFNFKSRFEL